jgi:hypothetical protein
MKSFFPLLILRHKTWQNSYSIGFYEIHFWGFIGHKKGFQKRFFTSLIPFNDKKAAWHFFGFRFTKTECNVSKERNEINGWYNQDTQLIKKLRAL